MCLKSKKENQSTSVKISERAEGGIHACLKTCINKLSSSKMAPNYNKECRMFQTSINSIFMNTSKRL